MFATVADFVLGFTVTLAQAAVFGLLAVLLASRRSRVARAAGGLVLLLAAWLTVVSILNRIAGYSTPTDIDSNVAALLALAVGWIAGRNRRLLASTDTLGPQRGKLVLDGLVRKVGAVVVKLAIAYGSVAGLIGTLMVFSIVWEKTGALGTLVGLLAAPLTVGLVPWYAALKLETWVPVIFTYGAGVTSSIVFWFGATLTGQDLDV